MPALSRQQIIAWSAVGLVILLIGANYLRGQVSASGPDTPATVTMGLKESPGSQSATGLTQTIKVHVTGAVSRPGLYELFATDRIADALAIAGGPAADADLSALNLAAKLVDGQQIVVIKQGEAPAAMNGVAAPSASGTSGSGGGAGTPGAAFGPVNLNTATAAELEGLDGVGPKTAQKIIEYREAHGGFRSVEELMEVPGIGSAKFEQMKGQVSV